uniref:Uncharacterized protein n=1 Tax=Sparus aurata TaxID=8175 RepID=A0A671Y349_SPAAU
MQLLYIHAEQLLSCHNRKQDFAGPANVCLLFSCPDLILHPFNAPHKIFCADLLSSKCLTPLPCVLYRIQMFDASLCGGSASEDALRCFFTHSLTQTLTYKPQLTVSDAITLQSEWTFAKANRLVTCLFRKLAVIFSVEQLLCHLQQVLETHEVNWKLVLCFLSTVLVYNPCLLSRLLTSAFEGYDLENMITAFLLARQGALEGASIFPSYSEWFKMSFGGGSGYNAASKKSLVFLLKFLSDLVPFEPPQYLKVHVLHPPFVPLKHRSLLMEYVSLAKTRLADLKVRSVEDMGLYEHVSGAGIPQCQAVQDVEKAVSLFASTGRISPTVMEASIFRRPYFLTRFLPALLTPRVLPVKPDTRMSFIEILKKADKIPAAQYSSYVESCQKQRQQDCGYSLISHFYPQVVNMILRNFCQCMLDASRANPPNKQSLWASGFVSALLGKPQLLSSLIHRLWDLFHNQGSSLSAAHLLGLAAFVVHLHNSMSHGPLVQLVPPSLPEPVPIGEALTSALVCSTHSNMLFSVCYGMCRGDSLPQQQQQDFILSSFYKKVPLSLKCNEKKKSRQKMFVKLLFSDWLANELRVQRSEDALSDPERQEYQQWACLEFYLPHPKEQGGCGGDMRSLCSHLLNAIMDQHLGWVYICTVTELIYEMEVTELCGSCRSREDVCDFLFEFVSERCSSTVTSASPSISTELSLHLTLNTWNRVLLALPAVLLIKVKTEGGRRTLDCKKLIKHVNHHQHWWKRLSPVLLSHWSRLSDGEPLPEQLQLLTNCQKWCNESKDRQNVVSSGSFGFFYSVSVFSQEYF